MLTRRLQNIKDRLQPKLTAYGHPQYVPVTFVYQMWNATTSTVETRLVPIQPNPKASNVPERYIGLTLGNNLYVRADDVVIDHVSPLNEVDFKDLKHIEIYGSKWHLIHVDRSHPLKLRLFVRKFNDDLND